MSTLEVKDFAVLFGCEVDEIPVQTRELIKTGNWDYEEITGIELNKIYEEIFGRVLNKVFSRAIDHDSSRWIKGWADNLSAFRSDKFKLSALVPKYIRPNNPIRLNGAYIKAKHQEFELQWYHVMRDWFFRTALKDFDVIYEFGSGSGHNVAELSKIYPEKKIIGLDWVQPSVDIIEDMRTNLKFRVEGRLFNFFEPDYSLDFGSNSAVLTMGALEQTGKEFDEFFKFLLIKKPEACFHLEPFYEFYNSDDLFDYLAIRSHEEKNFWMGFPAYIKNLQNQGKAVVTKLHRVNFGSLVIEGYSQLFWRPL
jgi:hypothetical protein